MTTELTTLDDPVRGLNFEDWRSVVSNAFVPLDLSPMSGTGVDFSGGLLSHSLGDLQLSEVCGVHTRVRRTPATIRRSDPGVIKVALQLTGTSTVSQRGREAALGPGDIAIYDTSERYDLGFTGTFDLLVAVVSRTSLRVTESELRDGTVRRIDSSTGIGALLRPVLESLHTQSTDPAAGLAASLVTDAVADLVSAALRSADTGDVLGAGDTILASARAFIESNLGAHDLSPASVAARHHVSVRHLQKLFAGDGHTVSGFIRQRRLERCRHDLADPTQSHRSIGSICAANGLIEAAHFSRLFKSAYGVSPRDFRERGALG